MQHNEIIYLSRLQHFLFCPRQFALIELEGLWEENLDKEAEAQLKAALTEFKKSWA